MLQLFMKETSLEKQTTELQEASRKDAWLCVSKVNRFFPKVPISQLRDK